MEKILLDEKYEQLLFQIPLLRDLPHNIKQSLLEKLEYSVYSIDKKDIVARQGTPCKKLYILLEGKLRVDIIDGLGNKVMVEYIVAPRAFATPHLFGSNTTLPATFTAIEDCILFTATQIIITQAHTPLLVYGIGSLHAYHKGRYTLRILVLSGLIIESSLHR